VNKAVGEGDTVGVRLLGFTVSGGTVDESFAGRNKLERIVLGDGSAIQVLKSLLKVLLTQKGIGRGYHWNEEERKKDYCASF
jgi:hypothetical protein